MHLTPPRHGRLESTSNPRREELEESGPGPCLSLRVVGLHFSFNRNVSSDETLEQTDSCVVGSTDPVPSVKRVLFSSGKCQLTVHLPLHNGLATSLIYLLFGSNSSTVQCEDLNDCPNIHAQRANK